MTPIQIIKKTALLLNVRDVLDDSSIDTVREDTSEQLLSNNFTINRMFEILKILVSNISSEYVPIIKVKKCSSINKQISIKSIDEQVKILQVRKDNIPVKYKLFNEAINLSFDGEFEVKYSLTPDIKTLVEDIDYFNGDVTSDLLVYGLASLYTLAVGLFDEFNVYNTIYTDRLSAIKALKIIDMPHRRWV